MKYLISSTLIMLLALAGGCGRSDGGEGVASANGGSVSAQRSADPESPSDDPEKRVLQFVACMRAQGIDVPDPAPGDTTGKTVLNLDLAGADKARLVSAIEKCQRYMPSGGENVRLTPEQADKLRRFAQCMRENGVPNWPDPDADGTFKTSDLAAINKDDPALRASLEKCRPAAAS